MLRPTGDAGTASPERCHCLLRDKGPPNPTGAHPLLMEHLENYFFFFQIAVQIYSVAVSFPE